MIKNALACLVALAGLLVLSSGLAVACTCIQPPTVQEELASSANVFSGRVVNLLPMPVQFNLRVTFTVFAVWKGASPRTLVVDTPIDGAQCGYPFGLGTEYLVYADAGGDFPFTALCGRTQELAGADADLAELGPPGVLATDDASFGMIKARFGD